LWGYKICIGKFFIYRILGNHADVEIGIICKVSIGKKLAVIEDFNFEKYRPGSVYDKFDRTITGGPKGIIHCYIKDVPPLGESGIGDGSSAFRIKRERDICGIIKPVAPVLNRIRSLILIDCGEFADMKRIIRS